MDPATSFRCTQQPNKVDIWLHTQKHLLSPVFWRLSSLPVAPFQIQILSAAHAMGFNIKVVQY